MQDKKVLVIPDVHCRAKQGGEDRRSLAALEKYMADHSKDWAEVVYIGDVLDLNCISSHNAGNLRAVEGETIEQDYAVGYKLFKKHRMLAPNAKITYLQGNHEFRLDRYIDANPVMEGGIEVPKGLCLKELEIDWVPCWSKGVTYSIGKATFHHGLYSCEHHAKKMVDAFGRNIFYGHQHDVQAYSKIRADRRNMIIGQSLGCLCEHQQYLHGRPTKWVQAFGVFHFAPSGLFQYYIPMLFNHRFTSPEGKEYVG
jgi:hypothetical protein